VDDPDRVLRDLGQRIVELRRQKKITQEKLAERMGIDARELRRVERGDNTTVRTVVAVAVALGVGVTDLFQPPKVRWKRQAGPPVKEDG
jgi:transcriptional regulator with XRE-family HTH domain